MKILILILTAFLLVPASAFDFPEIRGWQRSDETERYDPENLFEYINGAAESYLASGFEELEVAEYRSGEASVLIEMYRHASTADAFGIYSQERPGEGTFLDIGYQSYISGDIFCMVAGAYYIKLIGNRLDTDPAPVLENFARKVAARIPDAEKGPEMLQVFPADSLISGSERYVARNFLGYAFFRGAFTADYPGFRLFVIDAGSSDAAAGMLDQYAQKLNALLPKTAARHIALSDPYHGEIMIGWWKNFIWGAFNIRNGGAAAYVDQLGENTMSAYSE